MNVVRYSRGLGLLDNIQKEINDLLCENHAQMYAAWQPRVDIQSKEDAYVVSADLPGVDPKDIHVSLDGNVLTISGERNSECRQDNDGYCRVERFSGSFHRQFSMPENIDGDDIRAQCTNGVLELNIPKRQKQSSKRIEVRAGVTS